MDSHPYSYETSIFTLVAPHEEVQGRQTKLYPFLTLGKLVQLSPAWFQIPSRPLAIGPFVLLWANQVDTKVTHIANV